MTESDDEDSLIDLYNFRGGPGHRSTSALLDSESDLSDDTDSLDELVRSVWGNDTSFLSSGAVFSEELDFSPSPSYTPHALPRKTLPASAHITLEDPNELQVESMLISTLPTHEEKRDSAATAVVVAAAAATEVRESTLTEINSILTLDNSNIKALELHTVEAAPTAFCGTSIAPPHTQSDCRAALSLSMSLPALPGTVSPCTTDPTGSNEATSTSSSLASPLSILSATILANKTSSSLQEPNSVPSLPIAPVASQSVFQSYCTRSYQHHKMSAQLELEEILESIDDVMGESLPFQSTSNEHENENEQSYISAYSGDSDTHIDAEFFEESCKLLADSPTNFLGPHGKTHDTSAQCPSSQFSYSAMGVRKQNVSDHDENSIQCECEPSLDYNDDDSIFTGRSSNRGSSSLPPLNYSPAANTSTADAYVCESVDVLDISRISSYQEIKIRALSALSNSVNDSSASSPSSPDIVRERRRVATAANRQHFDQHNRRKDWGLNTGSTPLFNNMPGKEEAGMLIACFSHQKEDVDKENEEKVDNGNENKSGSENDTGLHFCDSAAEKSSLNQQQRNMVDYERSADKGDVDIDVKEEEEDDDDEEFIARGGPSTQKIISMRRMSVISYSDEDGSLANQDNQNNSNQNQEEEEDEAEEEDEEEEKVLPALAEDEEEEKVFPALPRPGSEAKAVAMSIGTSFVISGGEQTIDSSIHEKQDSPIPLYILSSKTKDDGIDKACSDVCVIYISEGESNSTRNLNDGSAFMEEDTSETVLLSSKVIYAVGEDNGSSLEPRIDERAKESKMSSQKHAAAAATAATATADNIVHPDTITSLSPILIPTLNVECLPSSGSQSTLKIYKAHFGRDLYDAMWL